mmetsp:Transcript_28599/g.47309  ORF Transcript_28599/g.47309 Transcript_28599/m.47309 type:complete len:384 (-) Transcript_28599:54-1205(-)
MSDTESDDDTGSKRALSAVERVARLSSKPDRQLSALRRLLGLSKLLHYVRPDQSDKAKAKHNMEFISICHEVLGDTFNSLFPGKTEAEIYDLTCPEVWVEVEKHLSKISVQNLAKLRMLLHTITRDQCSSMKRFTEKVFALVKRIKAAGMDISDGEVSGVLFCGVGQDAYAIQLDKWTSDVTGEKYSPSDIATELILLERELSLRATQQVAQFNNATVLVANYGYTVNPRANPTQNGRTPAAAPAPAPAPNPPPPPRPNAGTKCDYCGRKKHNSAQCFNRRRDLQAQIDEIDAALPAHIKKEPRPSRSQNESGKIPSSAGTQRPTALLATGTPPVANRPPTPGPTRPAALPAPASTEATNFFEQHQVPRNKFFEFPYSSEDSA